MIYINFFFITLIVTSTFIPYSNAFAQTDEKLQLHIGIYGPQGYSYGESTGVLQNKMANGMTFWKPADGGMAQFFNNHPGVGFIFDMFGASKVEGQSASEIDSQLQAAKSIFNSVGISKSGWDAMAEWDQSGGGWVGGGNRPRYSGLTRQQAYEKFTSYYLNDSPPLGTYLRQPINQRGYRLVAQTDYSPNAFYGYEIGIEVNMLERAIDELGDISTGLAFIRGAGKQYKRPWGIDISTWRTAADSATEFDSSGKHIGGWSPSYLRRHLLASYMAGAKIIQIEPTIYYLPSGQLNPFGQMIKDFSDFSLTRHSSDIGSADTSIALMLDFYSGFDTKHGPYNQANAVWYQDIPYSDGDYMIDNFFKVAYPKHWLHGTTPGAPFSDPAGYKQFLQNGGDPRPYEPMPTTRWGDNLDVILSNASLTTLNQYKVMALLGNVIISTQLRSDLISWVQAGGTLVLNTAHAGQFDQASLGVTLSTALKTGASTKWISDNTVNTETSFQYTVVTPTTATILANNNGADPIVTSNNIGQGRIILTTPQFLQSSARNQMLNVGVRLFDWLNSQYAAAKVSGPQLSI